MLIATEITRGEGYNPIPEFSVVSEDFDKIKAFFKERYSKVYKNIPWKENTAHYNAWHAVFSYRLGYRTIEVLISVKEIGFLK